MSGVELHALEGGKVVKIPQDKTTIGRGPFLEVTRTECVVKYNLRMFKSNDLSELIWNE